MEQHIDKILKACDSGEQRSPEWFAMRENFLTASDLGSVLGLNKFKSRNEVLLIKAGVKPKQKIDDTEAIKHGHKYESEAIDIYCDLTNRKNFEVGLVSYASMHENSVVDGIDCSFLAGSADGITCLLDENDRQYGLNVLEVKSPFRRWPKFGLIPEYYYPQLQMNLHILDVPFGDYIEYWPAGLQGNSPKMNIVRIYKDDSWFKGVIPQLRTFWDEVLELKNQHQKKQC
jgi:putative phage-type endonuclease